MCGINGFVDPGLGPMDAEQLLSAMLQLTHHRGPDNTGKFHYENIHLGHNRLSIIDLSHDADQPFTRGDLVMTYNGEVYNFIEIREELRKKGHQFHTSSDTEVILAAYQEWGADCVKRFIGMWAFVILDKRDKSLFVSRDRFGIKPLLYIHQGDRFYFSSEFAPLKKSPLFDGEISRHQLALGVQLGRLYNGDGTYFESIKNLPPAHNLTYRDGRVSIDRYWDVIEFSNDTRSFEEKRAAFRDLFLDAINIHLRSDVKLGSCLSGGLDSSAIASAVSHLYPDQEVNTFSIYYPFEGFDERKWISEVTAQYPNLRPTYYSPTDDDLLEHFDAYFKCQELPIGGSSPFSQYFLMRLAKEQGVTVTLDGQGADEYLAGYMYTFYRLMADDIRGLRFGKALNTFKHHAELREFNSKEKKAVLKKTIASVLLNEDKLVQAQFKNGVPYLMKEDYRIKDADHAATSSRFDSFLYSLTFHASLPNLLHFEDRNSMAFSLESRVPFLDHRLVEAGFALPPEDRIHEGVTKYMLRESMKGIIPDAIYHRQDKKGFNTPGEIRWLRGAMSHLLELGEQMWDYVDKARTLNIMEEFKKGNDQNSQLVWRLAMLNLWLKDQ